MTRLLALALAVVALAAVGCGGTSQEEYEDEINEIGQALDEEFTQIGRDIQASGGLENAAPDVEKGADAYDAAVADLKDIEPPDDAEKAHTKIIEGVELLAKDFHTAARAAAANDAAKLHELFGDFESREGFRKIIEARNELRDAGYNVEQ